MKNFIFILTALLTHHLLLAQIKYDELAQKPIGHNIVTSTLWRYAIKKEVKEEPTVLRFDTSFNADRSIKRIDTVLLTTWSSADFDYPDTLIEQKNTYNSKGLLVSAIEPYHIHIDQPCTLRVNYEYDEKNRNIFEDVFECDSFFHKKMITKYNDTIKQIRSGVIEYEKESYYILRKFDKKNRLVESKYCFDGDTSIGKLSYLKHGRIVKHDNYENGKQDDTYYTYYNRHHEKIKKMTVHYLPNDSILHGDTLVTDEEYFYYDKKRNLIREDKFDKNPDTLIRTKTYLYDAKHNLLFSEEKDSRYKSDVIRKYFYRSDGLLDYCDVFGEDKTITRFKYEYTFYK